MGRIWSVLIIGNIFGTSIVATYGETIELVRPELAMSSKKVKLHKCA
jgi:hypothetical protein